MNSNHFNILYNHSHERYIKQCKNLIDRLEESIKRVKENKFFGNPMSSSCVSEISELYGRLESLQDIEQIKEEEDE